MKPPLEQTHDEWLADYDGRVTPEPVNEVYPPDNDQGEGMVEEKALLPAGEYQATYLEHGLQPNFKGYGDKLVVSFTVMGLFG